MNHPLPRLGLAILLTAACGSAMAQVRVVAPDRLPSYWTLTNTSVDADVPNTGRNLNQPGCTAVTYTIGSDGVTSNVKVAKVEPFSDLGPAAASAVKNFRYAPSGVNRSAEPVNTYYVVQFNMPPDPAERARLTAACKLPGYEAK